MTGDEMNQQTERYEHDRSLWDRCAATYERRIVHGHPDVTAYESFEHSFLERLVISLTRDSGRKLACYDFGCGSGRIHLLLAPFLCSTVLPDGTQKITDGAAGCVQHIGGIDFSQEMIDIARRNLESAGLQKLYPDVLSFDVGSAFEVPTYDGTALPLAVSVCNSIGVMQGREGAGKLFAAMHRYVKARGGMAIISCYCKEAVPAFALGNYESTMDVCGQPCWLGPETFSSASYTLVPHSYKRAHDHNSHIIVDVFDEAGSCVQRDFKLLRNPDAVQRTIDTGEIDTYSGYHSQWYATNRIKGWMHDYWGEGKLWHIPGSHLDRLRGEPAQLAIVDYSGTFDTLAQRWGITPLNG
jgi:SAM-dependent methyltransferase